MTASQQSLGVAESPAGHTFADPDHIYSDRGTLGSMLRTFAEMLSRNHGAPGPVVECHPALDEWSRRTMIPDPAAFHGLDTVTVVGFFGRRRHDATPEVCSRIDELSNALFDTIPTVSGVYAYVTQLLVDEYNYANLVLVDNVDVIEAWRSTAPHPAAAASVSPDYYEHVRIYNGAIPVAALSDPAALDIHCVKYWDFRETPPWTAVRNYRPGAVRGVS